MLRFHGSLLNLLEMVDIKVKNHICQEKIERYIEPKDNYIIPKIVHFVPKFWKSSNMLYNIINTKKQNTTPNKRGHPLK